MRRAALIAGLALAAACCSAFAWAGGGHGSGFRLADASAACRVERGGLVCRSLAVRAGLALPGRGEPRVVTEHIWWDASTPVLRRWSGAGVSCRAVGHAILCTNASGATISVGSEHVAVGL